MSLSILSLTCSPHRSPDPRFRLLSYDHLGKTGLLVAHVSPPWALWLCLDKKKTPGEIAHVDLDGRDAAGRDLSGGEWGQKREMTDKEVITELIKVLAKMFPQPKNGVGRPPLKSRAPDGEVKSRVQVLEEMIVSFSLCKPFPWTSWVQSLLWMIVSLQTPGLPPYVGTPRNSIAPKLFWGLSVRSDGGHPHGR